MTIQLETAVELTPKELQIGAKQSGDFVIDRLCSLTSDWNVTKWKRQGHTKRRHKNSIVAKEETLRRARTDLRNAKPRYDSHAPFVLAAKSQFAFSFAFPSRLISYYILSVVTRTEYFSN